MNKYVVLTLLIITMNAHFTCAMNLENSAAASSPSTVVTTNESATRNTWTFAVIDDLFRNQAYSLHLLPTDLKDVLKRMTNALAVIAQLSSNPQWALIQALCSNDEKINNLIVLQELVRRGARLDQPIDDKAIEFFKEQIQKTHGLNTMPYTLNNEVEVNAIPEPQADQAAWLEACKGFTPLMVCALFLNVEGIINLRLLGCDLLQTNSEKNKNIIDAAHEGCIFYGNVRGHIKYHGSYGRIICRALPVKSSQKLLYVIAAIHCRQSDDFAIKPLNLKTTPWYTEKFQRIQEHALQLLSTATMEIRLKKLQDIIESTGIKRSTYEFYQTHGENAKQLLAHSLNTINDAKADRDFPHDSYQALMNILYISAGLNKESNL